MYADYYKRASTLADQIREGSYKRPERTPEQGLVPRPEKTQEPESGTDPLLLQEKMIASYMASLRKGQKNAPDLPVNSSPVSGSLQQAKAAIATIESEGSGGYSAIGPVMKKGSYKGDRAYGKYQVMGKNIPSWTKEALGYSLTPEEFLADESAQEAVADYRLQSYYDKHGTWEDAASVWFSGQPLSKAKGRSDGYLTVDQYVGKFKKNFNNGEA